MGEAGVSAAAAARRVPTEDEVLAYAETLSNWGRWGPDDRKGTLNYITGPSRVAAARCVHEGHSVSLSWEIDNRPGVEHVLGPPSRFFLITGQGLDDEPRIVPDGIRPGDRQAQAAEYIGLAFHGYGVTHLDGLSHIFWDQKMYNGRPASLVSSIKGATEHDITCAHEGITTRAILVDAARLRGVPWLEPGEGVYPDEIEAALNAAGLEASEGDALLLRTGYGAKKRLHGADDVAHVGRAGWHASCLPWLHDHRIALIGADTAQDVYPSGYDAVRIPMHSVGLVAMGLFLLDNCDLEDLSAACERFGRWEFMLSVNPLRVVGGTGSPVNPVATL